jgi:hypothetical protein
MRAQSPPVAHHTARPVGLIGLVGATLSLQLFLQAPLGLLQPLWARGRDRPGLLGAPLLEATLGLGQPPRPPLAGRQLLRELVAAALTEALILLAIDRVGLGENRARELLVIARRTLGRVRVHLCPVDRDHPNTDQAGLGTQRASTSPNGPANAASWRWRNRAIVVWSGARFAQITRVATSSMQRRSIRRDDRSPTA